MTNYVARLEHNLDAASLVPMLVAVATIENVDEPLAKALAQAQHHGEPIREVKADAYIDSLQQLMAPES